jgi:Fic/DOC family
MRRFCEHGAELTPGHFKTTRNQAGGYLFVDPPDVHGTLRAGQGLLGQLASSFHRAIFTMFLVAEVYPFVDGNGRFA